VHILPLQWPGGQAQQKGTDSVITLLLHDLAVKNAYDTGILLAADSDFVPPVQAVITRGKIVRNAYFSRRPSFHLQQACNGPRLRGDPIHLVTPASLKVAVNAIAR
jgi:uncharacterized LabA/DUF88 family protein